MKYFKKEIHYNDQFVLVWHKDIYSFQNCISRASVPEQTRSSLVDVYKVDNFDWIFVLKVYELIVPLGNTFSS